MNKPAFQPKHGNSVKSTQIMMRVEADRKIAFKNAAASYGLSLEEFCRQAMEFALQHLVKR